MSKCRIKCFFLEPAGRAQLSLRRWVKFELPEEQRKCTGQYGYHNASVVIGTEEWKKDHGTGSDEFPHDDPRWPKSCECGYEFTVEDSWQFNRNILYKRSDNGELTTIRSAPVGAMWYADWMPDTYRGPDGHCLVVKTPGGDWVIDGRASNSKKLPGWQRRGTPPNITATPSIGMKYEDGKWKYHAWLTNGELIDC